MKTKHHIFILKSSTADCCMGFLPLHTVIKFLAKVMTVPSACKVKTSFGKNLHSSLRSGSIFPKNLACVESH